jgi:hypothetical protein
MMVMSIATGVLAATDCPMPTNAFVAILHSTDGKVVPAEFPITSMPGFKPVRITTFTPSGPMPQVSGKVNIQGLMLTKQLFGLMDQQRCWYCNDHVGSPPSHIGDDCPRYVRR